LARASADCGEIVAGRFLFGASSSHARHVESAARAPDAQRTLQTKIDTGDQFVDAASQSLMLCRFSLAPSAMEFLVFNGCRRLVTSNL
jgi:hypothetical protein